MKDSEKEKAVIVRGAYHINKAYKKYVKVCMPI